MWVVLHTRRHALVRDRRVRPVSLFASWTRRASPLWLLVLLKLMSPPFVTWPWPLRILPADPHENATEPVGMQASEDRLTRAEPGESIEIPEAAHGGWILSDMPRSRPDGAELAIPATNAPAEDEYPAVRWERLGDIATGVWLCGAIALASVQLRRLLRPGTGWRRRGRHRPG